MTRTPLIAATIILVLAAFIGGFFYGRSYQHTSMLENTVQAFQNREAIDHETSLLSTLDACIAIGGLPNECAILLRGLDSTTKGK
ncbi:hypothetical protein [Bartonella sp. LJL80]